MDIMRMSASKFTAGWETALPHEAAMGPLSRFADVWSQRAQQQQQQQQQQQPMQQYQQQPPQSPLPPFGQPPQPPQQQPQSQQQPGSRGTPPTGERPMDKRTLKLQHAFAGMSLGEVLADSVKKTPPAKQKPGPTSNGGSKPTQGADAGSPNK